MSKAPLHRLIMDTREPVELSWLLQDYGFELDRVTLETGDYLWVARGEAVGVERKTVSDLLSSLGERQANKRSRVVNQLGRLRNVYKHAVLLLEGEMHPSKEGKVIIQGRSTQWTWEGVDNFLLTVQRSGIAIVRAPKGGLPERLASLMRYFDRASHQLPSQDPAKVLQFPDGKEVDAA